MAKIYLLNNQKFEGVENIEVFKIEYIKSEVDLKKYDALIITSKNAVYSLNSFNKEWKNIPCYAIAPKTAEEILKNGGKVCFTGSSGHGNEFAQELISQLKNKKAVYIRARKVVSNLVEILKKNKITIDELITYETVCNNIENQEIEDNSTIVFTSPSTIKCFFEKFTWKENLQAVVIGKTTAKYLPKNVKYQISAKTSVEECIKLAQMVTF